ncbi:hypothetical protein RND81_11G212100 [Saponaria officinalis]|uniref:Uncharacterized protein n=1 Tax=Saponaria officinalis TaxID=3572 RepID=A0AAW1HPN5_SAPOF
MRKLHPLILFLLILTQPKPGTPDPDDETCLTQLHSSFLNPTLHNWTRPFFSNPCFNALESHMVGITCTNNRVYRISLPNSGLSGSLSPSISKCTNLQTLDLSSNSLAGDIPATVKDLSNLAVLRLANNRFSSQIPPSLYLCAYLNVIDLHNNLLVGPIPAQLGLLARLSTFDVSYNRLSGMIPASLGNRSGNLARFNASDFEGNKELYGYPLGPDKRASGLSVMGIVGIGLGSGLLSLVVSFVIVCVWLKVSEHKLAVAHEAKISQLMPDY